jgi:hypothetical protein
MGSIHAEDVKLMTLCVTTVKGRATVIIGTLSKCVYARSNDGVFQLTFFAEQFSSKLRTDSSSTP